jgi:hypothetical protein
VSETNSTDSPEHPTSLFAGTGVGDYSRISEHTEPDGDGSDSHDRSDIAIDGSRVESSPTILNSPINIPKLVVRPTSTDAKAAANSGIGIDDKRFGELVRALQLASKSGANQVKADPDFVAPGESRFSEIKSPPPLPFNKDGRTIINKWSLGEMKSAIEKMRVVIGEKEKEASKRGAAADRSRESTPEEEAVLADMSTTNIDVHAIDNFLEKEFGEEWMKKLVDAGDEEDTVTGSRSTGVSPPRKSNRREEASAEGNSEERVSLDLSALDPDLAALLQPNSFQPQSRRNPNPPPTTPPNHSHRSSLPVRRSSATPSPPFAPDALASSTPLKSRLQQSSGIARLNPSRSINTKPRSEEGDDENQSRQQSQSGLPSKSRLLSQSEGPGITRRRNPKDSEEEAEPPVSPLSPRPRQSIESHSSTATTRNMRPLTRSASARPRATSFSRPSSPPSSHSAGNHPSRPQSALSRSRPHTANSFTRPSLGRSRTSNELGRASLDRGAEDRPGTGWSTPNSELRGVGGAFPPVPPHPADTTTMLDDTTQRMGKIELWKQKLNSSTTTTKTPSNRFGNNGDSPPSRLNLTLRNPLRERDLQMPMSRERDRADSPSSPRAYSSLNVSNRRERPPTAEGLFRDTRTPLPSSTRDRPRRSIDGGIEDSEYGGGPGDPFRSGAASRVAADWLGPRTARAFAAAGLIDSEAQSQSQSVVGLNRVSSGNWKINERDGIGGGFRSHARLGSESYQPSTRSGRASGENFAPTNNNNQIGHPTSPGSSGSRTLYSTSSSAQMHALKERHELETEALLTALAESKRGKKDLERENEELKIQVKELGDYVDELERRLAIANRGSSHGSSIGLGYPSTMMMGPPSGRRTSNDWSLGVPVRKLAERTERNSFQVPSRPATAADYYDREQTLRVEDLMPRRSTITEGTVQEEASSRRGSKLLTRRGSDESIFPMLSTNMSLILNERSPRIGFGAPSATEDDRSVSTPVSPTASPTLIPKSMLAAANNGRSLMSEVSPTEASFALTSVTGSPGSLRLRQEDEMHLNDLISLRGEDGDF